MRARDEILRTMVVEDAERLEPLANHHYPTKAAFLLAEGEFFLPVAKPHRIPAGGPRLCYHNSIMVACFHGLPYVEGVALNSFGMPFPHAWNLDERGRAVDTTWREDLAPVEDRAYLGVRFSVRRAHDCSWHGDACILEDWQRDWPLFKQPWVPEESPGDDRDAVALQMMRDYLADPRSHPQAKDATPEGMVEQMREAWAA